jgi:hypothetical protein
MIWSRFSIEREKRMCIPVLERERIAKPDFSALSEIALALPVTQVPVERSFSALNIILSRRGANLSSDSLKDILLIKSNSNRN